MSQYDPYRSPPPVEWASAPPPGVLIWYRIYALAMALLYVVVMGSGVVLHFSDEIALRAQSIIFLVMGLPFALAFGFAAFVPPKPWGWIVGIVAIGLGLTSPCCLPASIPLLIFWLKPETKVYFQMKP